MSQERGQARLPNPELLYLAYDPVLKAFNQSKQYEWDQLVVGKVGLSLLP